MNVCSHLVSSQRIKSWVVGVRSEGSIPELRHRAFPGVRSGFAMASTSSLHRACTSSPMWRAAWAQADADLQKLFMDLDLCDPIVWAGLVDQDQEDVVVRSRIEDVMTAMGVLPQSFPPISTRADSTPRCPLPGPPEVPQELGLRASRGSPTSSWE